MSQGWNDLNQLIKISDLNRDLNQMIFLSKKGRRMLFGIITSKNKEKSPNVLYAKNVARKCKA